MGGSTARFLGLGFAALALLCATPLATQAQEGRVEDMTTAAPWPPVATFSILGYDPETGEVGAAVQSRVFSVGNGVLWGKAGVGIVATQAIVDVSYGPQALELLELGYPPEVVIQTILEGDPDPDPERWTKEGRQFSVMDAQGNVATHTGPRASDWAGHQMDVHVSAQGNILAGEAVVEEMVRAFQETEGRRPLAYSGQISGSTAEGDVSESGRNRGRFNATRR